MSGSQPSFNNWRWVRHLSCVLDPWRGDYFRSVSGVLPCRPRGCAGARDLLWGS